MEKNVTPVSAGLKFGLYTGLALIAFDLILFVSGMKDYTGKSMIQYLGFIILIAGVVMGIKHLKDSNDGFLTYGQSLGAGTMTALIAGLVIFVYTLFYMNVLDTEAVDFIREAAKDNAMTSNPEMTDEQWEQASGIMDIMTSPTVMGITATIMYSVVGFIVSLIAGAFMKNDQDRV